MEYTRDFPDTFARSVRLGYRLPRSILLPPYLEINDFFIDLADSIDSVFSEAVDTKTDILRDMRNMWVSNPDLERKIMDQESTINKTDWSIPEQNIVLKQLNMLGLQLGVPTVMFNEVSFMNLCRYIGMFWFEKGRENFIDFINFCCETKFVIKNLWTENYVDFYPEGDENIGTPIWKGGTWYPTTHVQFQTINPTFTDINIIAQLFYEISNYNLVLESINCIYNIPIRAEGTDDGIEINTGFYFHENIMIYTSISKYQQESLGYLGQYMENFDVSHFYE